MAKTEKNKNKNVLRKKNINLKKIINGTGVRLSSSVVGNVVGVILYDDRCAERSLE